MAFDRTAGRALMLYERSLWQWDGASWSASALPAPLESCRAATLMSYHGARNRTVVVGCTVPGQTWEHDGTSWHGPFAGPYQALVLRDDGMQGMSTWPYTWWRGTLQLPWAHPNALFESEGLGGVSTFDADGTLRTWNGADWQAGPALPEGYQCVFGEDQHGGVQFPWRNNHWWKQDFLAQCFFPPAVDQPGANQVLVMRDGFAGLQRLDLLADPATRGWEGFTHAASCSRSIVNPYPMELMSPEHVYLLTQTDASSAPA